MSHIQDKDKILNGNLWKLAFGYSWPAIIALTLYGLNLFFDAFFVGLYVGEQALASLAISYPVVSLMVGIGSLVGIGAGSLLSIALGEKDEKMQSKLLGNLNALCILLSIVYVVVALLFGRTILSFMGPDGVVLDSAHSYFKNTTFGVIFWVYGFASNMIIRAEGKMKLAALVMGAGLVVNILFNALFIVVLDFGIEGAAWGTNIGMLVYSALGMLYFLSKSVSFVSKPFSFEYDKTIIKKIISLGMASFIMILMALIQAIAVFQSLSRYGNTLDIAVYGAIFRVYTLLLMPIGGFMRALQPIIGINFGAKNYKRVIDSFLIFVFISTLLILPICGILFIFPKEILSLMVPANLLNDNHLHYFRLFLWGTLVIPFLFMGMSFYPSIGKGKPAAIIGIVRQVIFYLPVMLILPAFYGIKWIYLGASLIEWIIAVVTLIFVVMELLRLKKSGESVKV